MRILKLAAANIEDDVAAVLEQLLRDGIPFDEETVTAAVQPPREAVPVIELEPVQLAGYDSLLVSVAAS